MIAGLLRILLPVLLLASTGCASLSLQERYQAEAIAAAARTTALDCPRTDHCPLPSPLHALGEEALMLSQEAPDARPVHFATLLEEGEAALVARLNLIRSARQGIDLQTYIFDTDDSGRLVIDELLAAARRGVKVRVLIDQLSAITDLQTVAALSAAHANFQLRVYNPTFGKVQLNYWDYAASVICCFRRFNQRMHNKLLVIDDAIGIVGGRNYQDDYFDWDAEYNFRDRDVIIAGPEVQVMARNFDAFWDAPRAVPAERLNDVGRFLLRKGVPELPPHAWRIPERIVRVDAQAMDPQWIDRHFVEPALRVDDVRYVADLPDKHSDAFKEEDLRLDALMAAVNDELLLQTPYLIISDQAEQFLRQLRSRQEPPAVMVSTNSLAATDNPIVYALSYKYKRRNVRDLGLRIFEYKPFPADPPVSVWNLMDDLPRDEALFIREKTLTTESVAQEKSSAVASSGNLRRRQPGGSEVEREVLRAETRPSFLGSRAVNRPLPVTGTGSRMGLHAKSLVIDRRIAVIGTHNFDPRSENYNTEGMVVIRDAGFANALAASIERDISPENSWVVAPRQRLPMVGQFTYNLTRASEALPVMDIWPWRYATVYEYHPQDNPVCSAQMSWQEPDFHACYRALGDFPGVNVGGKWLLVRMLTAFGAGLVPIL